MKPNITLLLLFISYALSGQIDLPVTYTPEGHGISSDSLKIMDHYFHKLVDEKKIAGIQTGVLRNGKLIHFDSYGFADIEHKIPLDHKSVFRIYSMTKPIVSVALMQLYEQGKFKLNDPLHKYIPAFKKTYLLKDSKLVRTKRPIRIIDLLRHTSGYTYGNTPNVTLNSYYAEANLYASKTNEEFVQKLSNIPLQFEPGTNWQYGLSTNICGYLIEVLSGLSLKDYLHKFIFTPLEMEDTHFQLPENKIANFTTSYGWNDSQNLYVTERGNNSNYATNVTLFSGGGGLISTTFDYLKFCQMLLNKGTIGTHQIVKESTLDLLFSDHLKETRKHQNKTLRLPPGEASFGLGFAIRGKNINNLKPVYGWGGALGTYFKIDTEHNLAYVMMIQLKPHSHLGLRKKVQEFMDASILY